MYDFSNKNALVTGASSGIGEEIAKSLARAGAFVWVNFSKSREAACRVVDEIKLSNGKASLVQADVSDVVQVKKMFGKISRHNQHLDFLVNNAGIDIPWPLEEFSEKNWSKVIAVNLTGKFLVTKYAIPLLQESPSPRIVNVASRLSKTPLFRAAAYCCASAGIISLTKSCALELSKFGIRTNVVCPGFTRTPLTEGIYETEEVWKARGDANPSKRVGVPEDIAKAVLFLLSDEADYINGSELLVDGGSNAIGGVTLPKLNNKSKNRG